MPRRSIEIDGFGHANPIPAASRVGPLLVSSIIPARDPGSDHIPDDVEAQIDNLFRHVGAMLAAAGAGWEDVAKMTFYVPDLALRDTINGPWAAHFPDAASRPARHTQVAPGGAKTLSCDFLAYVASSDEGSD
jgi:enamine deaminase RidA (YjgF/YER057c/UK114 family)